MKTCSSRSVLVFVAAAILCAGAAHAGGNGIYRSPPLNRPVPSDTDTGTTVNWVTGAFDDTRPGGDWDATFLRKYDFSGEPILAVASIDTFADAFVIRETNERVVAVAAGASVGPDSIFSATGGENLINVEWRSLQNGYMGFRFHCDGRLPNPVPGGLCYGYVHVVVSGTAGTGFPATLVEYAFDGDGNPIQTPGVTVTPSVGTPGGTIAPDTAQVLVPTAQARFTMMPDSGFHLDGVDGTCAGTLAGNLFTTAPVAADCSVVARFAAGAGSNGIYRSPVLNAVVDDDATSLAINWVTAQTIDNENLGGPWDAAFRQLAGLRFVSFDGMRFAVTETVTQPELVSLLQPGDTVGDLLQYQGDAFQGYGVQAWQDGADGYAGFQFRCDGRLASRVAGGICYGYVHLRSGPNGGFPLTIVEYAYDGDGHPITIPGATSHTVTPVVGSGSGSISPSLPVSVREGTRARFTPTPADGFHVASIAGCGDGYLDGNVYVTAPIHADCTLTVDFADGAAPAISLTPAPMNFTVAAGASATQALTVQNAGGGVLTYSIGTAPPLGGAAGAGRLGDARARPSAPQDSGYPIAQMADDTPLTGGLVCGNQESGTVQPSSWWRRFYFDEHPRVGRFAKVVSVAVSASPTGSTPPLPFTVTLYTIPHSTPADTIVLEDLTQIGTASVQIGSDSGIVTIPVSGVVDDTVADDLVVKWELTEFFADGIFFPGANDAPETHPTFFSSTACAAATPRPLADFGVPVHQPMTVTLEAPGDCQQPGEVPWLVVAPAAGSLAAGAAEDSPVTADATALAPGSYSASLCVASNDLAHPVATVPVQVTVTDGDGIFSDGFDHADGARHPQTTSHDDSSLLRGATLIDGSRSQNLGRATGARSRF